MLEVIVCFVEFVQECYGFQDFKLKGGVLWGEEEIEVVIVLLKCFLEVRIIFDLNGVWLLEEVIVLCKGK